MFEKEYFKLTKFFSNSRNVLTTTLEERLNEKIKKQGLVERPLIIQCDIENKYFGFEIQLKYKSLTSRRMLPTISTVYDPLGIAASFVLEGLQILHRLCQLKVARDKKVSDNLKNEWIISWQSKLPGVDIIKSKGATNQKIWEVFLKGEVHHFSDAKRRWLWHCSCLRIIDQFGAIILHC